MIRIRNVYTLSENRIKITIVDGYAVAVIAAYATSAGTREIKAVKSYVVTVIKTYKCVHHS